jgi:hypothetical protein
MVVEDFSKQNVWALFHYTDNEAYKSILSSGIMAPSKPWTVTDSYAGDGWYFTDIQPSACVVDIALGCWKKKFIERVKCYFKFRAHAAIVKNTRPHVFMLQEMLIPGSQLDIRIIYSQDNNEVFRLISHGKMVECKSAPCKHCLRFIQR